MEKKKKKYFKKTFKLKEILNYKKKLFEEYFSQIFLEIFKNEIININTNLHTHTHINLKFFVICWANNLQQEQENKAFFRFQAKWGDDGMEKKKVWVDWMKERNF